MKGKTDDEAVLVRARETQDFNRWSAHSLPCNKIAQWSGGWMVDKLRYLAMMKWSIIPAGGS